MNAHNLAGIRKRDQLLTRFKKDKTKRELYREFCKLRNSVQRDMKSAEASYLGDKIKEASGDSGNLWSHLKYLRQGKARGGGGDIVLEQHGEKIFESRKAASVFNNFDTSVADDLVKKLPNPFN